MWWSKLFWKLIAIQTVLTLVLALFFGFLVIRAHQLSSVPTDVSTARPWPWRELLSGAAFTGLSLLCVTLITRRAVRPLRQLSESAQKIANVDDDLSLPNENRDEVGFLGFVLNQMQRRLSRRVDQLKENSERLTTVLGSMVEGVIAVRPDGALILANEASRNLLDITTLDPIGRRLLEVNRCLAVHEAVEEAFRNVAPVQREFESTGPTRRVLSLRATRLPGAPCPGVMVVLHDVTELRRLENLRRELVANVSHELKTPLALIKTDAENLRLGAINDPDNNLNFVRRIEEQADLLNQMILDLLQLARVESGSQVFEITDVSIADVVLDCMEYYVELAHAKGVSITSACPPDPVFAWADEEGVRTILSNLIDNAVKYTPAGGSVVVSWRADENMAVIEVQDTGIGIAAKDQSRVFERFYRVDKARSRERGGTGLGLAIVKNYVQRLGGSVALESSIGVGSKFQVRLPKSHCSIPSALASS